MTKMIIDDYRLNDIFDKTLNCCLVALVGLLEDMEYGGLSSKWFVSISFSM